MKLLAYGAFKGAVAALKSALEVCNLDLGVGV